MKNKAFQELKRKLMQSAIKTRTPIGGVFELTPRCNLDCKMCYVHNANSNALREKELPTEIWKRIFDEAYELGLLYATLTGGECLLRSDFKELYLHLWKKRVNVSVLTNGVLINEEYIDFFKRYMPDHIQISLYGSCEEGYLNVTGHRGFEKVVSAIRGLEDAGIDVRVTITPSSYIRDDYMKTVRFVKENGFNLGNTEMYLISNRDNPEKADYYLTEEEIFELTKEKAQMNGEICPVLDVPPICGPMTMPPKKGMTCSAGNCVALVTWEGKMHPCVNAMIGGANVLEVGYAEAWRQTVEVAAQVVHGAECVGCPYDKTCPKCPAMRLTGLHTGHCKPEVCELTRRLVAAGAKKLEPIEKAITDIN